LFGPRAKQGAFFRDRETGVEIKQLTGYNGHSHPCYVANTGWYDGGRKLLFASDASGYGNLHLVDTPDWDSLAELRYT